jgi:predicted AlkP superfamily pyrophosphatase or phosphodiesterase
MARSSKLFLAFTMSLLAVALLAPAGQAAPERPSRVMIIVLDQARPDTITRYGMKNVQELQRKGTSFPNAIVGDMAAETVISHNVITSGLFPKHMGWTNEVYRDTGDVLGPRPTPTSPPNFYVTSSMSCSQYQTLISRGGYDKLQDYLDSKFESAKFASIAEKRTSACTSGHTRSTDPDDIILQIRGSAPSAPDPTSCDTRSGWRKPEYANGTPPPYFADLFAPCSRWWTWQQAGAYGTDILSPGNIYPLDGDRFVPGFTPGHVGGDNWSADAAIRVIGNDPTWRGMMVSLGGIDKLGHMWGPEDRGEPGAKKGSVEEMRHLPFIARNADVQVGRILDALEAGGQLDETLVVITADHAAQTGDPFFGELAPGVSNPRCDPPSTGIRSDCNWYLGQDADEVYLDPPAEINRLRTALGGPAGNLAFSYQDGHIAVWLKDNSLARKREAADAVLDLGGVIASFHTNDAQNDYQLYGTNKMTGKERNWFESHGERLVDTMAAPNAPDVVGLLRTDVTYGTIGDHGGHTRLIQNIPMVFYGPGVGKKDPKQEFRHVDVLPTILTVMGIAYDPDDFDGHAVKLSGP